MPKSVLILVVDDDADHLDVAAQMLRDAGYRVASSRSAEAALSRAKVLKPDLILTDLAMPEVGGAAFIEHARADPALKNVPILAVTAHVWDEIAQAARNAGVDGFITKPFGRSELLNRVEKQLTGKPLGRSELLSRIEKQLARTQKTQ